MTVLLAVRLHSFCGLCHLLALSLILLPHSGGSTSKSAPRAAVRSRHCLLSFNGQVPRHLLIQPRKVGHNLSPSDFSFQIWGVACRCRPFLNVRWHPWVCPSSSIEEKESSARAAVLKTSGILSPSCCQPLANLCCGVVELQCWRDEYGLGYQDRSGFLDLQLAL